MHSKTKSLVRYATLATGLLVAAWLTYNLLNPAALTQRELWVELFTGSGLAFVIYSLPYVIYIIATKGKTSTKLSAISALLIIALSTMIIVFSRAVGQLVQPQDVPIVDPTILLVLAQTFIASVILIIPYQKRSQ